MQIEIVTEPTPEDILTLEEGLEEFSAARGVMPRNYKPLALFARDSSGQIIAGLTGGTNWGWLHIRLLWVAESLRNQGYGHKLVSLAEQEALKRDCHNAIVDTFSFQAHEFYQKIGYEVYGVLEDFPPGYERIYLQKRGLIGDRG